MRAESLSALIVSSDDAFCRSVADCLRWSGAERALRVRSGRAARAELENKRFFYSVIVLQIIENVSYEIDFIEGLLRSRDMALRSIPFVAIATATTRAFYAELGQLGFTALVPAPVNRVLLRETFLHIFKDLQREYRNPDLKLLRRALSGGDLDFVEERCTRALQHQPDHRSYSAYLGEVFYRKGEFEKALEKSEAAIVAQDGGSIADGLRLKAKVLHKMGRSNEAWEVLPRVLKLTHQEDQTSIQGLVPVLNSYATHLKAADQLEEAILYYNLAMGEPDAREHESRLLLNLALAHMKGGSHLAAYESAEKSLALSGGQSQKARELIAFLRKNYPEIFEVRESGVALLQAKIGAGVAAQKERKSAAHISDGTEAGRVGLSEEELSSLEADLTEDIDLPDSSFSSNGLPPELPEINVFQSMEQLGRPSSLSQDSLVASSVDSIADELSFGSFESPADFDFSVSADQIASAKEIEAKLFEDYQVSLAAQSKTEELYSNILNSDTNLDEALQAAFQTSDFTVDGDQAQDRNEGAGLTGEMIALADEIQEKKISRKAAGLDEFAPGAGDSRPALDADLASLLQSSVSGKKAKNPASPKNTKDKKSAIEGSDAASGTMELARKTIETQIMPPESVDESDESGSSQRIKWDVMSREQIVDFLLFKKEHPAIKIKRLKIQPRRRHGSLVPID